MSFVRCSHTRTEKVFEGTFSNVVHIERYQCEANAIVFFTRGAFCKDHEPESLDGQISLQEYVVLEVMRS